MKKLIFIKIALFFSLLFSSCTDEQNSENLVGSWCLHEGLNLYKLIFLEDRTFRSQLELIGEITLERGTWTVRDQELIQTVSKGADVLEKITSDLAVSNQSLVLTTKRVEIEGLVQAFETDDFEERVYTRCDQ